jgi:hypothetical protein
MLLRVLRECEAVSVLPEPKKSRHK